MADDGNSAFLSVLSLICGYMYTIAWSLSFYPQAILNWQRKSVRGLSFDFLNYNFLGFFAYSLFNGGFYWNKSVQQEYFERHPNADNIPVQLNDVLFAFHALVITTFTIGQTFIYERGPQNRPSIVALLTAASLWLASYALLFFVLFQKVELLDYLYWFSYVKLFITFVKYVPQAYSNYKRKSTVGWSIYQVTLDFTGGILSLLQSCINAINYSDPSQIIGNPSKFGLALFSLGFDTIFMIQHYYLYPVREKLSWRQSWNKTLDEVLLCGGPCEQIKHALKLNVPLDQHVNAVEVSHNALSRRDSLVNNGDRY